MQIITQKSEVLKRFAAAAHAGAPLLCPNAETPDEMEGILLGAQQHALAVRAARPVTVGIGFTASYPDHAQLRGIALGEEPGEPEIEAAAATWLGWLGNYAGRPEVFPQVEVIPFLDHGWAPHASDLALMRRPWFQEALGVIMFDASLCEFSANVRMTADFVQEAGSRVVVEACPDKVYERGEMDKKGLRAADLLSHPDQVERFVKTTGVDLIVPNLGTEHRSASREPLAYRRDIARDIAARVGSILALHGTSSLRDRIGTVGQDGICKVNYYTAMAQAATEALRRQWGSLSDEESPTLKEACGGFVHRTRRTAVAERIGRVLRHLDTSGEENAART